jgi:hypothetical protein
MSEHEDETTTPPATEGDREWRERTQDLDPDPNELQPPPPAGEDVQGDRYLP